MQIKTECLNETCGRALLIEDFQPGMAVPCPFCGESFTPPAPAGEKLVLPAANGARASSRSLADDLNLAADLRGDVPAPKSAPANPAGSRAVMKRAAVPTQTHAAAKPATAVRPKVPTALTAKAAPAAKRPEAILLPSKVPTKPDLAGFEVIEEAEDTPMMAIPVEDDPPRLAARPAAKPAPPKPAQAKPAPAAPQVMKAILIEEDEEPVMNAILITPPKTRP